MSSERQIVANRLNGAKSLGPVTPEGRLASSRNATTLNGESVRPPLRSLILEMPRHREALLVGMGRSPKSSSLMVNPPNPSMNSTIPSSRNFNPPRWLDVFNRYETRYDRQLSPRHPTLQ